MRSLCQERGVGVLWATHLVDEAEQAQRVVLHQGMYCFKARKPNWCNSVTRTRWRQLFWI
ncbi:MAG: hypothetical protein R3F53_08035 [Gammaproteobacteria bacterium]